MRDLLKLAALAATLLAPGMAQATVVYSNNFDGASVVAAGVTANLSGASVQSVQGLTGLGASGNQFGGDFLTSFNAGSVATLTLSNLPSHTSLNLTGLLAALDSWDSTNGSCCTPDLFVIRVDGNIIFSDTYAIALGTIHNTAGLTDIGGGNQQRGFNGGWLDAAFDLENELQNIAHTASSMTITFSGEGGGWQGGTDEAWGIDNLVVSLNGVVIEQPTTPVPEPVTLSLLGAGLTGIGTLRRKRA